MTGRTLAQMRTADLQKIHIARKQLAMSEDTYRSLLREISKGRTDSSGQLTHVERAELLRHMERCGFKVRKPRRKIPPTRDLPIGQDRDQVRKIRALWISLHEAGAVRDSSERAMCQYIKNQTAKGDMQGKEHPRFLDITEASQVIERLKQWLARVQKTTQGGQDG